MEQLENVLDTKISPENLRFIKELLSATSSVVCILNRENEVVYANSVLLNRFGIQLDKNISSMRFGQMAGCVNVTMRNGICGSGERCQYCGANYAFKDFWKDTNTVINECRLVRKQDGFTEQLDLEITASPFPGNDNYMVVSLIDVTDKRRREILERIFFHDIINMAGSLKGVVDMLLAEPGTADQELLGITSSLSSQILEEIKAQQQLIKAEKGELKLLLEEVLMTDFLHELKRKIQYSDAAFERKIIVEDHTDNTQFTTDKVLLTRVIFNMAKNALEAISRGQQVLIAAKNKDNIIRIEVHNSSVIERDVQMQLFQRSFSTKGDNRGIGTYSMKMLGERYLKGRVNFETSSESGTTFFIEIPLSLK